MWLHSLKVAQLLRSAACLHTNQSRSYLNHLVDIEITRDHTVFIFNAHHSKNVLVTSHQATSPNVLPYLDVQRHSCQKLRYRVTAIVCISGQVKLKVKVKVKCTLVQALRLCTGHTAHRGSRGIALPFLDHGNRRGEGSASRSGRSLPRERPGTHCTGGCVGPRARLDRCGKYRPPPEFDPQTVQHVAHSLY